SEGQDLASNATESFSLFSVFLIQFLCIMLSFFFALYGLKFCATISEKAANICASTGARTVKRKLEAKNRKTPDMGARRNPLIAVVEISVPLNEAEASILVTDLAHCISFFALVSSIFNTPSFALVLGHRLRGNK
ncbi:hypothetical protein ACJX0J_030213, partial [Zea mays]